MINTAPDPNPGRCNNFRAGTDAHGYPKSKRCLLYENKPHECKFPPDDPPVSRKASGIYVSTTSKPKPWVSPLDSDD